MILHTPTSADLCYLCGAKATMVVTVNGPMRGVVCDDCAEKYRFISYDDQQVKIAADRSAERARIRELKKAAERRGTNHG